MFLIKLFKTERENCIMVLLSFNSDFEWVFMASLMAMCSAVSPSSSLIDTSIPFSSRNLLKRIKEHLCVD